MPDKIRLISWGLVWLTIWYVSEFEKFGLKEFDKNILENEIIKKYISESSLFQSLEKIFENLKVAWFLNAYII